MPVTFNAKLQIDFNLKQINLTVYDRSAAKNFGTLQTNGRWYSIANNALSVIQ